MPLPIVIDVGVADPPRELTNVLVEACSRAAAETECHLVREAPEGSYVAIAVVTWEAPDRVRIEVGLRRETGSEWRSRQISFQPADVELERYRSVGFVIGTLATSTSEEADLAPAPPAPPPAPVSAPEPIRPVIPPPAATKEPPPRVSRGFVGLAGFVGAGIDEGAPRFGGTLRAGVRVVDRLAVLVSAGASTRVRDERGLLLTWLDAGLGLSYAVGAPTKTHLELRLEFIGEHFSADADSASGSDTRGRTISAARTGVDGVLMLGNIFGIVAGVDGTLRSSITHLRVAGEDAGQTLVFDPGVSLGVRLEL